MAEIAVVNARSVCVCDYLYFRFRFVRLGFKNSKSHKTSSVVCT